MNVDFWWKLEKKNKNAFLKWGLSNGLNRTFFRQPFKGHHRFFYRRQRKIREDKSRGGGDANKASYLPSFFTPRWDSIFFRASNIQLEVTNFARSSLDWDFDEQKTFHPTFLQEAASYWPRFAFFALFLSLGITLSYLELRLFLLGPSFPLVDDLTPQGPEVFLSILLETHAARGDGNLWRLRRPPRVAALAGERI